MTARDFNAISDRAVNSLRVDDFDDLLDAVKKLRPGTVVGLRENGKLRAEFVELVGDRVQLRDTKATHRLYGRSGPRHTVDVNIYDLVAVTETKFGRRK